MAKLKLVQIAWIFSSLILQNEVHSKVASHWEWPMANERLVYYNDDYSGIRISIKRNTKSVMKHLFMRPFGDNTLIKLQILYFIVWFDDKMKSNSN